ncbi:MAG: Uma2 family endonuclease [Polyangiales bacterium]
MRDLAVKLSHPPTLADIDALPPHMKGEIIDGVFYAMTRPRGFHQNVAGEITSELRGPFQKGRGGPGGWWILPEPGIEFPNSPEVSPDVAGWKRERMPAMPREKSITVAPDWVCEVLSNTTRRHDLRTKKPFYARMGVAWMWVVDPDAMLVTAHRNEGWQWVEVGAWADEKDARIPPFEAAVVDVSEWWVRNAE